eukprot:gnl/MRDRNA2_/MRDRNA2_32504_c0_seq1.p1 gnl/MRDRNA2_/MRDRNA2_32504_c0~~gnl/MRDRNA2_/MRDRNA2_32504_c0_seq1.p1  ORF type:complete len:172 (+),score=34.16 gnl/MRDRNA2_/MRDRNA2_32504_c0_seq1:62-517(+)
MDELLTKRGFCEVLTLLLPACDSDTVVELFELADAEVGGDGFLSLKEFSFLLRMAGAGQRVRGTDAVLRFCQCAVLQYATVDDALLYTDAAMQQHGAMDFADFDAILNEHPYNGLTALERLAIFEAAGGLRGGITSAGLHAAVAAVSACGA